jgi:hypothetical protein
MTDPHTILRRIADQYPSDIVYTDTTHGSMLQALLDEEGPEALVQAVLDAAQDTP